MLKVLFPAYGRKYNSKAQAIDDYTSGKDFRLGKDGPYCSCRDFRNQEVSLNYGPGLYVEIITPS
jgi:hypothetical protein